MKKKLISLNLVYIYLRKLINVISLKYIFLTILHRRNNLEV